MLDTNARLGEAIDVVLSRREAIGPLDAVLVTGDISDDGTPASYALARAQLERLGLPLMAIPGNHDRRAPFRAAFADTATMREAGPLDRAREVAGTLAPGSTR